MKKMTFIILSLMLLTGCTASYNLRVDNDNFSENINSSFNYKNLSIEELSTLSSFDHYDTDAFYKDSDEKLNKSITYDGNKANININYDYTKDNFDNSYLINNCFDGHVFLYDDNYYYIELIGDFSCQYASSIDINIITDYMVVDTNAVKKKNKYTWTLTDDNNKDVNMYIKINKHIANDNSKGNSWIKSLRIAGFIILIILSVLAYLLYRKKNSDEI